MTPTLQIADHEALAGCGLRPPAAVDRASAIGAGGAADVLAAAAALEAAGRHVVHLEVGEPDTPTPPHVVDAGVRALHAGHTRYGPPAGLPALRAAIAESLRARGVPADPAHVVVSPGAKAMLFTTLLAAVRPGDEVLVPTPATRPTPRSPSSPAGARCATGSAPATPSPSIRTRWRRAARPARAVLVLNLPGNPTGGVAAPGALERLAALAAARDLLVVSDEVYARYAYGDTRSDVTGAAAPSIAALPGMAARTVLVDGFSKAYAMTGWRLGYGLLPAALVQPVAALLANSASCTATFVQHAGLAALTGPQDGVAARVAELRDRRDSLVAALNTIDGVRCVLPAGAFYAFPSVGGVLARLGLTTEALAHRLLAEHGVACVPGTAFGPAGTGHLRLAFTAAPADLALAVERLRACAAPWSAVA
jgi:aspartate/methionine/tyrosine aminotransferase